MNATDRYVENRLNVFLKKEFFLIEMSPEFKNEIQQSYQKKSTGKKLIEKIKTRNDENDITDEIDFLKINDLLYYAPLNVIRKLIIPQNKEKNFFELIHDQAHHEEFHRVYVRLKNFYVRHIDKKLRKYINHCRVCNEEQTKKHVSYEELNSIKSVVLFFHTVAIDFVVALSFNVDEMNSFMSITDKFFQKNQFHIKKNNMSRVRMSINMIECFTQKGMRFLENYYFRSRQKISFRILKSNLPSFGNKIKLYRGISLKRGRSIETHKSNDENNYAACTDEKKRDKFHTFAFLHSTSHQQFH